jgi:hypothetical protein
VAWLCDHAGNLHHRLIGYRRLHVTPGTAPSGDRVAIYLLFPTDGLRDSHLMAIDALRRSGCAVLAVSNLPLADGDLARLAGLCRAVMVRPNVGYDFGAYLDAIRWLDDDLPHLRQLVLMNDSVWYPVPGTPDWVAAAQALGADVVGSVWNYGVAQPDLADWRSYRWQLDPRRPGFHYCSFALSLGPNALRSAAFRRFWRRLVLTDDKIRTVRRGEVGLSRALLGAGLSHACTLDLTDFERELGAMSGSALRQFVADLVVPQDPRLEALRAQVLADTAARPEMPGGSSGDGHDSLRRFALAAVAAVGPAYAMPGHLISAHGYPFLKKSPLRLAPSGAATTLALASRLTGPGAETIAAEARALATPRRGAEAGAGHARGDR